jgi:hypothetical protein
MIRVIPNGPTPERGRRAALLRGGGLSGSGEVGGEVEGGDLSLGSIWAAI